MENAFAYINGIHPPRAMLQQAIGKAPCGGSYISAGFSFHIEVKSFKCGLQFLTTAGDKPRPCFNHELCFGIHFHSRLVDHLVGYPHLTSHHKPLSLRTAIRQSALHKEKIEAHFLRHSVIVVEIHK